MSIIDFFPCCIHRYVLDHGVKYMFVLRCDQNFESHWCSWRVIHPRLGCHSWENQNWNPSAPGQCSVPHSTLPNVVGKHQLHFWEERRVEKRWFTLVRLVPSESGYCHLMTFFFYLTNYSPHLKVHLIVWYYYGLSALQKWSWLIHTSVKRSRH